MDYVTGNARKEVGSSSGVSIQSGDRSGEICASQNLFVIEIAFGQRRRTFAGIILQQRFDMLPPLCSLKRIPQMEECR